MLLGREAECALLDRLLDEGRRGRSGVLVLRGVPGIGKTALLEDTVSRAQGYRVLRAVGVQSEAEFAFATVHQLLRPVLDCSPALPEPQRQALEGAFGLADRIVENRFLVSLGVLGLLAEVAEDQPLLCVVDDAHWLDLASADALRFAARRLYAERVVILFAARAGEPRAFDAAGLQELSLSGLPPDAARRLAEEAAPGLAPDVRDALVRASAGNPLGLRELPRSLSAEQRAGAAPLPDPLPATSAIESVFSARIREQPLGARMVMLIAAASRFAPVGVVSRASALMHLQRGDLDAAEGAGLLRLQDGEVAFTHPLVRSAVYGGATLTERQAVHRALAAASRDDDPDGAAWHLAAAATGPDDVAADGLEHAALNAQRRGGYAAASIAFHQAAVLSTARPDRTRRLAAAGVAAWRAGQLQRARELLSRAQDNHAEPRAAAEVAHVLGMLESLCGSPRDGLGILMAAARPVLDLDPPRAARLLGEAAQVAWTSGELVQLTRVAELLRGLPGLTGSEAVLSLGAQAVRAYLCEDYPTAADLFRRVVRHGGNLRDLRAATLAAAARVALGDDNAAIEGLEETVAAAREAGAVEVLPGMLALLASSELSVGRYSVAAVSADEGLRLAGDTGQEIMQARLRSVLAWLAAVQGRGDECRDLADQVMTESLEHRPWPPAVAVARWALGIVDLGAGRYAEALSVLDGIRTAGPDLGHRVATISSAADLVEAAVRTERADEARPALAMLESWARSTSAPWGQALVARCHALLDSTENAEVEYAAAVRFHEEAAHAFDAARTELLFGEWLRRRRRRTDARDHLRRAHAEFARMGAAPWAQRAWTELRATGETAQRRVHSATDRLTPQELQIARAVARGATNREVAAQVFLSPRTVDYHLHKVFTKLGISSRTELVRLSTQPAGLEPLARG